MELKLNRGGKMNPLDLKETITYTQQKRLQIVEQMTAKGLPTDPEELTLLNKTLDALDKSVAIKEKLVIDASNAHTQKEAANILNHVLSKFVMPKLDHQPGMHKVLDLSNTHSVSPDVPDELYIGVQEITLNEIMKDD